MVDPGDRPGQDWFSEHESVDSGLEILIHDKIDSPPSTILNSYCPHSSGNKPNTIGNRRATVERE